MKTGAELANRTGMLTGNFQAPPISDLNKALDALSGGCGLVPYNFCALAGLETATLAL